MDLINNLPDIVAIPTDTPLFHPPVRMEIIDKRASKESCEQKKEIQDRKYLERRRRNNIAAKKSRDKRKLREDMIAVRVAHLESENKSLRSEVAKLREETSVLQVFMLTVTSAAAAAATTTPSNNV